ncbi:hypothetical protein ABPG74_011051 [Tetrahymena malaccensis]
MDDKEFLGYFEALSKKPINQSIKQSVLDSIDKIVKTLQAVSHTKSVSNIQQDKASNQAASAGFVSLFGEKIIEDVDYAIKRCVRGGGQSKEAYIQMHYCLALKNILEKFGSSINIKSLIEYIVEQVSKKNALSKSEVKHFSMGRLALFKCIIISEIIEKHCENAQQIYDLIYQQLESEMSLFPQNVLDICENIFQQKLHQKHKAKLYFNHILKNELKNHTGVSLRALVIGHFAHKMNNNATFAQQSYLDDKINSIKNLKNILNDLKDHYPQEHTATNSLIAYLRSIYKKESQWTDFWKNILKEFCLASDEDEQEEQQQEEKGKNKQKKNKNENNEEENSSNNNKTVNYRNYFVAINLFRRFIKSKDFSINDFKCIAIEELLHLWIRHFQVKNEQMRNLSTKTEKSFSKLLSKFNNENLNKEERKSILDVFYLLRAKTTLKFTPKMSLAKTIYSFMNQQEASEFLNFLKKQMHKSTNFINEYVFYLNEMYVFAEFQFSKNPNTFENEFYEICYHLFESTTNTKLSLLYSKQNDEVKGEITEKSFIQKYSELITQLFNSLLSSTLKIPSLNFKDQKSYIWRGLNSKNEFWIFNILKYIVKKAENFTNNEQLTHTIKELQEFIDMANKLEKEIKNNLEKKHDDEKGFSNKKKRSFCNLLIGVCVLSLFYHDEGLQNLDELKEVYESIVQHYDEKLKKEKPKKKVKISNNEGKDVEKEDENFIQVLSDLLVSLLTKSAHYMREITNLCFQTFVHEVDQFSLQTLIDVIARPTEEYLNDMPQDDEEGGDDEEEMEIEDDQDDIEDEEENDEGDEEEDGDDE